MLLPALAMWSASQHREQLKQLPTLYRDTRDFIQNISSLKALPVHYFVRLDIEEIFVSGDPQILACDAAGLAKEGPRKRLLFDVDHFLLTHQFVTSKRHPERLWRVQKRFRHGDEELWRGVGRSLRFLG